MKKPTFLGKYESHCDGPEVSMFYLSGPLCSQYVPQRPENILSNNKGSKEFCGSTSRSKERSTVLRALSRRSRTPCNKLDGDTDDSVGPGSFQHLHAPAPVALQRAFLALHPRIQMALASAYSLFIKARIVFALAMVCTTKACTASSRKVRWQHPVPKACAGYVDFVRTT
jgi:hypothetical protein